MIKFNSLAVVAVCFAVLAPGMATAQIKKSGGGYLMRLKFKPGQVAKYSTSTSISGLPPSQAMKGGKMQLGGTMTEKVVSVSGNTATIQVSTSAMTSSTGTALSQPQSATLTVDTQGKATGGGAAASFGVHFPATPVKVGGTWKETAVLPATVGGGGQATTTYKFNGIKAVGKKRLADVSFTLQPVGMMSSGTGHAFLDPADGSMSGMHIELQIANPQGGSAITTAISIQRIS